MKRKYIMRVLFCFLVIGYGYSFDDNKHLNGTSDDKEKPVNIKLIYEIGSDKENEDFYEPKAFAVDSDECIYVLDTKNSRVQCFSKEGKFKLSFGRYGQGPGELTKFASKIKILEDQNIYIIDGIRINIYDKKGKFIKSIRVDDEYNDIEMIDGKYYLSNCNMEIGSKPIHVIDPSGKIVGSFGIIIEPEEGIMRRIDKAIRKEMLYSFFSSSFFSRLIKMNNKEIIYSLCIPYRLITYNAEGQVTHDVSGKIDYGGEEMFPIIYKKGFPFIMPIKYLPFVFAPVVKDDDTIIVPFLKRERDYLYIDYYDKYCNLMQRYKIQERVAKEGSYIRQVYIDNKNYLYCLVGPITSDDLPHINKYKLLM
jgi:hypothetical protein